MIVEHLKHEGTSHSSSDLLKICASWSAQTFRQEGLVPSLSSVCERADTHHPNRSAVQVEGQSGEVRG